jgi:hypothetical protein
MEILAPISPGELIDKLTILEIKLKEITDEGKLVAVRQEHDFLNEVYVKEIPASPALALLQEKLLGANQKIWNSENHVREFWNDEKEFNRGAKESHFYNDERAKIKREINALLGSSINEVKSHPAYEHKI